MSAEPRESTNMTTVMTNLVVDKGTDHAKPLSICSFFLGLKIDGVETEGVVTKVLFLTLRQNKNEERYRSFISIHPLLISIFSTMFSMLPLC